MKQTWKKLFGLILISIFVLSMTACGSDKKTSASTLQQPDESMKASLIESFTSVVQNIAQLDEASIESYLSGEDAFSASAANAWEANGENLGGFVECKKGSVEVKGNEYVLKLNCTFENRDAVCTFLMDKTGTPTSVTIDPVYSMGEKMEQAGMNTVIGLVTVFVMLIFLSFVISLMKYIPGLAASFGKKKAVQEEGKEQNIPAALAAEAAETEAEEIDDGALIAVIAAAIAASENTSTDSFIVRSIRKSTKRNWQRA